MFREVAEKFGAYLKITAYDLRDPQYLVTLLDEIGFKNVIVTSDILDHVYTSISTWWDSLWTHGTRGVLEQLSENERKEMFEIVNQKLQVDLRADGLHEQLQAFYITAQV